MKPARLYVRTPAGRAAAFGTSTSLAASLRPLLVAVDGKTPTGLLEVRFMALGSVAHLLVELESAGLIRVRSEAPQPAARPAHSTPVAPVQATASNDNARYQELMRWERAAQPAARAVVSTPQVTDAMATFILTHLPDIAHAVLTQLEAVQTHAQLQALLPSYEAMVKRVEPQGQQHWEEVRALASGV